MAFNSRHAVSNRIRHKNDERTNPLSAYEAAGSHNIDPRLSSLPAPMHHKHAYASRPSFPSTPPYVDDTGCKDVQGMEDEIMSGCIVWKDEAGTAWCLDVHGKYGAPGAVSFLESGDWVISRGGRDDGCILWEDETGMCWCKDVAGAYGPAGEVYHSQDGEMWFGESEAWLELGDEAAEYFAARESTKQRRQAAMARGEGKKKAKPWENDKRVMAVARETDAVGGPLMGEDARRRALYGDSIKKIEAEEARMNVMFDAKCQQCKHVVWPEMPLKM